METKVDVLKAMGDCNRLRILNMLSIRELCVCEINAVLNVSMSTISSHLKILRNAGLVTSKKDGRWIIYSLNEKLSDIHKIVSHALDFISSAQELSEDKAKLAGINTENCTSA